MTFSIRLAGKVVQIQSLYPYVKEYCKEFWTESETSDLYVKISEEDLQEEYRRVIKEKGGYNKFRREYLESLAVYRKITEGLLEHDILLFHGAVMARENKAFIFTAPSGTGKTTIMRHFLTKHPDFYVVNGDKPLIRVKDHSVIACGTPWCGKENLGSNTMVPIHSIFLLKRGNYNKIEKISFSEAIPILLQQTYRFFDESKFMHSFELLHKIGKNIELYNLTVKYYKNVDDMNVEEMDWIFQKSV